jgi:hypothetical protein
MVCRNGQARSSRDRQTGRDSHHRTFRTGRGSSSGRVRRPSPDCYRERANRNNPAGEHNRDRRTRRAFGSRQIFSSSLTRPACSGPDCRTGPSSNSDDRPCQRRRENRGRKGAKAKGKKAKGKKALTGWR